MTVSPAFDKARADNRAALVGYLPAGFPTLPRSVDAFHAMVDAGVDLVEVGLPYSDPVIDGPVIQEAADRARANGVRTRDVLDVVSKVASYGVPTVIMTYWNPVERYGVEAFARDLAGAGGSGLITPDLIPDEASEWLAASDAYSLDRIFLVAPSSTDARIAATTAACRGFVYATSVMGVTGAREQTSAAGPELVARTRRTTDLPIGIGLGVRDGAQAAAVGAYADAVIVGSALVSCLLDNDDDGHARTALAALTAELASGVRNARA